MIRRIVSGILAAGLAVVAVPAVALAAGKAAEFCCECCGKGGCCL
jgi:hypothetical protein